MEKGIDGFRMDVINMISKVSGLPDAAVTTPDRYQFGAEHFINGPRLLEFLGEMKQTVLAKYDILTVGETPLVDTADALAITDENTGALNMLFQFEHMDLDAERGGASSRRSVKPLPLLKFKEVMSRWQKDLEGRGWNSIYLTNHDQPRPVSRYVDDTVYRVESAKMLATLTHLLQGTPYVYQGEEIGMTNVPFDDIEDFRDIETLNIYREMVEEQGNDPKSVMAIIRAKSRDNARTPMQWDASAQAGFTTGEPWLQVASNYPEVNVEKELAEGKIFRYYQELIGIRKEHPVIADGSYEGILLDDPEVFAYIRENEEEKVLVLNHFYAGDYTISVPKDWANKASSVLAGNYGERQLTPTFTLKPYETIAFRMIK